MSLRDPESLLGQRGAFDVPPGWSPSRVKYLGQYVNGYPFKPTDWEDHGRPILRIQNLTNPAADVNRFSRELPKRYLVERGDIVISWSASLGVYRWDGEDSWLNQHSFKVIRDAKTEANFFYWLASWFMLELNTRAHGSTMQHLTLDAFGTFPVLLPPLPIQRVIADYLDRETGRIDLLVAAKERLLDILAEKRQALITSAVTRGLDADVRMRDSGVSWLGDIPQHWEVRRVATLFEERDEREEPDLPLLTVSINTGVTEREFADDKIERVAEDFNTYKVANKGDIAFNKMRMWQGAVGVSPTDGLVSPDYVVAHPIADLVIEYFGVLLRIPAMSAEFTRHSHGIVWDRLRLYWEDFRNIYVPFPPLPEQRAIAAYVAEETAKLNALRDANRHSIDLLKERRAALVAAAVTGQIDVPVTDGGQA